MGDVKTAAGNVRPKMQLTQEPESMHLSLGDVASHCERCRLQVPQVRAGTGSERKSKPEAKD